MRSNYKNIFSTSSVIPLNDKYIIKKNINDNKNIKSKLDEKILKEKRYYQLLNDFINDVYIVSPCDYLIIDDVINDYKCYIENNSDKIKNFNGRFGLNLKDMTTVNDDFKIGNINFCKSCNKKYFKNCCINYKSIKTEQTKKGIVYKKRALINIKRKSD